MENRAIGVCLALILVSATFVGLLGLVPSASAQADDGSMVILNDAWNTEDFFWGPDEDVNINVTFERNGIAHDDWALLEFESDLGDYYTTSFQTGWGPYPVGHYTYTIHPWTWWADIGHWTVKLYRDVDADGSLDDSDLLFDTERFTIGGMSLDQGTYAPLETVDITVLAENNQGGIDIKIEYSGGAEAFSWTSRNADANGWVNVTWGDDSDKDNVGKSGEQRLEYFVANVEIGTDTDSVGFSVMAQAGLDVRPLYDMAHTESWTDWMDYSPWDSYTRYNYGPGETVKVTASVFGFRGIDDQPLEGRDVTLKMYKKNSTGAYVPKDTTTHVNKTTGANGLYVWQFPTDFFDDWDRQDEYKVELYQCDESSNITYQEFTVGTSNYMELPGGTEYLPGEVVDVHFYTYSLNHAGGRTDDWPVGNIDITYKVYRFNWVNADWDFIWPETTSTVKTANGLYSVSYQTPSTDVEEDWYRVEMLRGGDVMTQQYFWVRSNAMVSIAESTYMRGEEVKVSTWVYGGSSWIGLEDASVFVELEYYDEYNGDYDLITTWSGTTNLQGYYDVYYLIPSDALFGRYYVHVYRFGEEITMDWFDVVEYEVELAVYAAKDTYYSEDEVTFYYSLRNGLTNEPISGVDIEYWVYGEESDRLIGSGTVASAATLWGSFTLDLPTDAEFDTYTITMHAVYEGQEAEASDDFVLSEIFVYIGTDKSYYKAGEFVIGYVSTVDGASLSVQILKIDANGEFTTTVGTMSGVADFQGWFPFSFETDSTDSYHTVYKILVTATYNSDAMERYTDVYIGVCYSLVLDTSIEKDMYYPGEEVTVEYHLFHHDDTSIASARYEWYVSTNPEIYGSFEGATEGTFTFAIPGDYEGTFDIGLRAYNDTHVIAEDMIENVVSRYSRLFVNLNLAWAGSGFEYEPGQKVTVSYTLVKQSDRSVIKDSTIWYKLMTPSCVLYYEQLSDTDGKGTFSFEIPEDGDAASYTLRVWSIDSQDHYESYSTNLVEKSGVYLEIWMKSSYISNSYKPGDKITIHYRITGRGVTNDPQEWTLVYGLEGHEQYIYNTYKTEGTFEYTVPKSAEEGPQTFYVEAVGGGTTSAQRALNINKGPSPLDLKVAGGLSLLELILLVFVILLLLVVIILPKMGKGDNVFTSTPTKKSEENASQSSQPSPPIESYEKNDKGDWAQKAVEEEGDRLPSPPEQDLPEPPKPEE